MRHRAKTVKVRKPHNCWFCGMLIPHGDFAVSFFAVDTDRGVDPIFGHACLWCANSNNIHETRASGLEIAD